MQKEIVKEVYDAVMVLFKNCASHKCDECPFCFEDGECMFFESKPIDWNGVTEDNGHYFVKDEAKK